MVLIGSDPGGGYNLCWCGAGAEEDRSKIGGGVLAPVEAATADDIVGGGPGGVRRPWSRVEANNDRFWCATLELK